MAKASRQRRQSISSPQPHNKTVTGSIKYGNRDKANEYDLTDLNVRPDQYVVKHFGYMTNAANQEVKDESTARLQVYDKEDFDRLNKQTKSRGGKQEPSPFESLGLGVELVHEPE